MNTSTVWSMTRKSQEFRNWPRIELDSRALRIGHDFETDDGSYAWEYICFLGPAAFTFTTLLQCRVDQLRAYDRLVEVHESPLIDALRDPPEGLHHYRIFFDDPGCYEVVAASFRCPG